MRRSVRCMTLRSSAGFPEILLRRITPEDKDALVAGLGLLSERSVYQRFLAPKPRLTSSELRYLTEVDFLDHYALVAVLARSPEVLVGVGRWVRCTESPTDAEIAIVVADDLQGRGVGTQLGRALTEAARRAESSASRHRCCRPTRPRTASSPRSPRSCRRSTTTALTSFSRR